jgi:hypothetical protein
MFQAAMEKICFLDGVEKLKVMVLVDRKIIPTFIAEGALTD